jgi:hypothetical protein
MLTGSLPLPAVKVILLSAEAIAVLVSARIFGGQRLGLCQL